MSHTAKFAGRFTATTNTAVAQAQTVARQTVERLDDGSFCCEDWCRSMLAMFNIMAQSSAAYLQTALSEPCCACACFGAAAGEPCCGLQPSAPIHVAADATHDRQLSVVAPFTRVGGTTTIPVNLTSFSPAILLSGATTFAIVLGDARYIGASYTGTIRLTRITKDPTAAGWVDVVANADL